MMLNSTERQSAGDGLLAALADDIRRSVYSAVVLETGTTQEIGERVGIPPAQCAKALAVLKQVALVEKAGQSWSAGTEVWRQVAPRRAQPPRPATIPAKQGKRQAFLVSLVPRFSVGQRYPECEVNQILGEVHPDFAALRRYLVEAGLLLRADGYYWRP